MVHFLPLTTKAHSKKRRKFSVIRNGERKVNADLITALITFHGITVIVSDNLDIILLYFFGKYIYS